MRTRKDVHRDQNIDDIDPNETLAVLYKERDEVTSQLQCEPLNFDLYLQRAAIYCDLGYPDLAAGDAYRALTLLESYFDPDFSDFHPELRNDEGETLSWPDDDGAISGARRSMAECLRCLVLTLTELGCLRDAYAYLVQLEQANKEWPCLANEEYQKLRDAIHRAQSPKKPNVQSNGDDAKGQIEPARLRNSGFARREIYRWNNHEPDRSSPATLKELNEMLKPVAPYLEVRLVELPILENPIVSNCTQTSSNSETTTSTPTHSDQPSKSLQLGLFATSDLPPSSSILHEPSVLSAIRPLAASLCHNCGANIAPSPPPICCPTCTDAAIFCSPSCLQTAQSKYHATTCGSDELIDPLGRADTHPPNPSEDLYFLLLARTIAMSHQQDTHPLLLPETRYLYGAFTPSSDPPTSNTSTPTHLPFTFHHTITLPFQLLTLLSDTHPSLSPFSPLSLTRIDTWVIQTLYAKFRGVASARQSTWDGRPEVAAVHPLWCLANHSCAPNVGWGWEAGRERVLRVREGLVRWKGNRNGREGGGGGAWRGIRAGEEILTHYCDVDLEVGQRREYMRGSLGGECVCERCVAELEEGEEEEGKK